MFLPVLNVVNNSNKATFTHFLNKFFQKSCLFIYRNLLSLAIDIIWPKSFILSYEVSFYNQTKLVSWKINKQLKEKVSFPIS